MVSYEDNIATSIRRALEKYFRDLDGEKPCAVYDMVWRQVEKTMFEVVLEKAKSNQTQAAQILGINRNTLRKKLSDYDLL